MGRRVYELTANVGTGNPRAIRPVLEALIQEGSVEATEIGFTMKAKIAGESARDLNRALLSASRKVEKKTRLRPEWAIGKTVERFFDHVPKTSRKSQLPAMTRRDA
jgi:hypothetical protein